jgi:lipopolysaccharide export system protein LptA
VDPVVKRAAIALAVLLAFGLTANLAGAEDVFSLGTGSDQPIKMTAKKITRLKLPQGEELTFEGNVRVRQGQVTLTCDRLVAAYDNEKHGGQDRARKMPSEVSVNSIRSMTASGNVKLVQDERMAVAGKALFDNVKRTITLSENPRLWQGPDVAIAHTIVVYLDENRSELKGNEGEDISVLINPGKHKKDGANGKRKEKNKEK